ncbi:hypothetical protein VIGAN_01443900 [Vigna angularis var. angularis]|uniref:Uncharacterized protein n=1 Tax=Vigna angularis var. angularis TaxID=157739 RepID=A0A0S3R748_PHAAN|nr:hypothetical protein VIGAN_01443900 [Vigna angularis var. angularis]
MMMHWKTTKPDYDHYMSLHQNPYWNHYETYLLLVNVKVLEIFLKDTNNRGDSQESRRSTKTNELFIYKKMLATFHIPTLYFNF